MSATAQFIKLLNNPFRFRLFLLSKIPAAYFSGVRIKEFTEQECRVTVPYKWFSQNPFRSTYFACLAMAGEMSTGTLAMAQVYKRQPRISMLVINMEAVFTRKATGLTIFTCSDGKLFQKAINETTRTGEAVKVIAKATGRNEAGDLIAEFLITWSFKSKSA